MSVRTILILAGAVAVVAGAVTAAVYLWPDPPPPDPAAQTPEQVTKYMASKEFGRLDAEEKREYFEAARQMQGSQPWRRPRGDLSEEQRRQLRQNVAPMFRQMMESRVEKYFELPAQQRVAYLDEMIDGMQAMRKAMEQRPQQQPGQTRSSGASAHGSGERGPHGRGFTPERMKRMIENTPPERRARFVEFHKVFRARMEQRGINFGGSGRGGPPRAR